MDNRIRGVIAAVVLTGSFQQLSADQQQDLAWRSLPPPTASNSNPLQTDQNVLPNLGWDFAVGDVRTQSGNQSVLVNTISEQTNSIESLLTLALETIEFNENTLEVLVAATDQAFSGGSFSFSLIDTFSGIFITNLVIPNDVLSINGSIFVGSDLAISSGGFGNSYAIFDANGFTAEQLDLSSRSGQLGYFDTTAPLFYSLNVNAGGNFDALVDGFIIDSPAANVVNTEPGNILITDFNQSTTMTGTCPPCQFNENDNTTFEAVEIGGNVTHGVSWASILPPFNFSSGAGAESPNGVISYITANELTPRDQLPNTGVGTYDNLIGGAMPYHATTGAGQLNNFSATVDFATANVTALSLDGQFGPAQTFSANATGPAAVAANGTFQANLDGVCAFCASAQLNGQFLGGFVSNGNAVFGAYGLRAQNLPGSTDSIVGSVLATQ